VIEEGKVAILLAATILAARRLIDMDPNKPKMAKGWTCHRRCCFYSRAERCGMADDCEFDFC